MDRKLSLFAPALLLASGITCSELNAALDFQAVALSGQPAPGTPNGEVFSSSSFASVFDLPRVNDAGQISFTASYESSQGGVGGIWLKDGGTLSLQYRGDVQAPGASTGALFGNFRSQGLNNAGQTAFVGTLQVGPGGIDFNTNGGVWTDSSGSLEPVALGGAQAPGTLPGEIFDNFRVGTDLLFNDSGQVAFSSILLPFSFTGNTVTYDNWQGIWTNRSGALELVARQSEQAPGLPAGVNFVELNPLRGETQFNNAGHLTFNGELQTGVAGITNQNNHGIWSDRSGTLGPIVRGGDQAPDTPTGAKFTSIHGPSMNQSSRIAFFAGLETGSGGVVQGNSRGVWSEGSDGVLSLVARSGDQAPGAPNGVGFGSFDDPILNDAGQTTFKAKLTSDVAGVQFGPDEGVWTERLGNLELIAREGDQAPGMPDGAVFSTFKDPVFDDLGRVLFVANMAITPGVIGPLNNTGLWAFDTQGNLELLVREGASVQVAPGDVRFVTTFSGGQSNPNGLMAFSLDFFDGSSGVFTAQVPEPASLCILMIGSGVILRRMH